MLCIEEVQNIGSYIEIVYAVRLIESIAFLKMESGILQNEYE